MDRGVTLSLVWKDNDMVEVRLVAWNGSFGGVSEIYIGYGVIEELANALAGFPISSGDSRDYLLGDLKPDGQGGARMRFNTLDMAGHTGLILNMVTGDLRASNQEVTLSGMVEATAIDQFVTELRNMKDEIGSKAFLRFA